MESSIDSNNEKIENKTFVSNFLRELINLGYGKNKKIIRIPELKKIKFHMNINEVYNLKLDDLDNNESEEFEEEE